MVQSFDVIVVGAGIVGAACAREFAQARLRVAVCEALASSGSLATGAAMGHIAVMDDSEAQFALTAYSQQLWRELASELPSDIEYSNCGALWVASDDQEFSEVVRKQRYYTERGVPAEVLDPRQLAEAEPALRPGLAGALLLPNDSVCNPPAVTRLLLAQAEANGARTFFQNRVKIATDRGVQLAGGTHLHARALVIAAGVESATLVPQISIQSRKGHLAITAPSPDLVRHQVIELGYLKSAHKLHSDSVAFNVQPRRSGQILIGSSRQYGVTDPSVEQPVLARMLARAAEYVPELKSAPLMRTWTGLRAATPDKLPLIGLAPGLQNVYLATGHEGLGISTSLATARLLADRLLHRVSLIDPQPYEPRRRLAAAI